MRQLAALVLLVATARCAHAQLSGPLASKNILVLHAYEFGIPAYEEIDQGLLSALYKEGISRSSLDFEFLDLRRHEEASYRDSLAALLGRKYESRNFDLVIAVATPSLSFVMDDLHGRYKLFTDVPVVGVAISDDRLPPNGKHPLVLITDHLDIQGTIRTALDLLPDANRVLLVSGAGDYDRLAELQAVRALQQWTGRLEVTSLSHLPLDQMLRAVSEAPPRSFVLCLGPAVDVTGRTFVPAEVAEAVGKVSAVPVFGIADTHVRRGLVGGYVKNYVEEGKAAGRVAVRILKGELAMSPPPPPIAIPSLPLFDWRQIRRWRLDDRRLPPESVVENRPVTIWSQHPWYVAGTVTFVVLESLLIVALSLQIRRRRAAAALLTHELEERMRAEEALRTSEERFRLSMEATSDGLWEWTVPTGEAYLSPGHCRMLAYDAAELPKTFGEWMDLVHPDDRGHAGHVKLECVEGRGDVFEVEYRAKSRNGEWHWILSRGKCISRDSGGRAVRLLGTHMDITELRKHREHLEELVQLRTEELVHARDQATAANRAKSAFLANMSHELRTPLNSILGFTRLLRENAPSSGQKAPLDIINRSGEHLLSLINDVLDVAKIEAGKEWLTIAPCDVLSLANDVSELMRGRADARKLPLIVVQSPEFPRYVRTDAAKLRQILFNLLGNAINFTERGSVTLRLSTAAEQDPDLVRLRFQVEDTGIGISPEDQARIFEPFFQAANDGAPHGTGLGLTITRRFVEMMGGTLRLESETGRGSRFVVEVPAHRARQADVPGAAAKDEDLPALEPDQPEWRVVIVEDDPDNAILLEKMLRRAGFQVRTAENGALGIELFRSWRPHFIWMDLRMPLMSGTEAAHRIRGLEGGGEVKIAAITASVFVSEREEVLAAGMDDFVRKPYRPEEIFACMGRHLGVRYCSVEAPGGGRGRESALLWEEALAALPREVRRDLATAIISLDRNRVSASIARVAGVNRILAAALRQLHDKFAYTAILDAIERSESAGAATSPARSPLSAGSTR